MAILSDQDMENFFSVRLFLVCGKHLTVRQGRNNLNQKKILNKKGISLKKGFALIFSLDLLSTAFSLELELTVCRFSPLNVFFSLL